MLSKIISENQRGSSSWAVLPVNKISTFTLYSFETIVPNFSLLRYFDYSAPPTPLINMTPTDPNLFWSNPSSRSGATFPRYKILLSLVKIGQRVLNLSDRYGDYISPSSGYTYKNSGSENFSWGDSKLTEGWLHNSHSNARWLCDHAHEWQFYSMNINIYFDSSQLILSHCSAVIHLWWHWRTPRRRRVNWMTMCALDLFKFMDVLIVPGVPLESVYSLCDTRTLDHRSCPSSLINQPSSTLRPLDTSLLMRYERGDDATKYFKPITTTMIKT